MAGFCLQRKGVQKKHAMFEYKLLVTKKKSMLLVCGLAVELRVIIVCSIAVDQNRQCDLSFIRSSGEFGWGAGIRWRR